ncbi:Beta-N-acetylhexosaminidase, partial [Durusdinium trenchii]
EDAEFLFLRVIGIRKVCSRVDIAHRLKASMNSIGPLSNWAEGIDITDLEDRIGRAQS